MNVVQLPTNLHFSNELLSFFCGSETFEMFKLIRIVSSLFTT